MRLLYISERNDGFVPMNRLPVTADDRESSGGHCGGLSRQLCAVDAKVCLLAESVDEHVSHIPVP